MDHFFDVAGAGSGCATRRDADQLVRAPLPRSVLGRGRRGLRHPAQRVEVTRSVAAPLLPLTTEAV